MSDVMEYDLNRRIGSSDEIGKGLTSVRFSSKHFQITQSSRLTFFRTTGATFFNIENLYLFNSNLKK